MFHQKTAGLFFILFSLALHSTAQEQEQNTKPPFSHIAFISGGKSHFDPEISGQENIKDNATTYRLGWISQREALILGLGLGFFTYSDNDSFSQSVRPVSGSTFTERSDATGTSLYGEVGYAYHTNDTISLDAIAGLEIMASSERTIPSCSDCYSEDIDIDTGIYLEPRFRVSAKNGFVFMLSYRQYLSGDVEDSLNMGFGWMY